MTSQTREEVARIAGRLIVGQAVAKGQQENLQGVNGELQLSRTTECVGCGSKHGPDGTNFCLVDAKSGQHFCLSLYGKVFDGYDHAASALFGGFVANKIVSIYDYQEAFYFDYQL
jgi:hypothetical protein